MQKIVSKMVANPNLQAKEKELVKTFDEKFTILAKVAIMQALSNHNATLFNTMCTNMHNDLKEIDGNIKELRQCIAEGKKLYG